MKIAVVSGPSISVPPKAYGGSELFVYNLCEGLIETGHHVTLFATGDSETRAELKYLYPEATKAPQNFLDESRHSFWAAQEIRNGNFDVVQINHPAALIYSKFFNMPVFFTMHHPKTNYLYDFYANYPEVNFVAVSRFQSESLPFEPKKLSIIHHGLDTNFYDYSYSPGDYLAYLGRFSETKGVHYAVESALIAGEKLKLAGSCIFPRELEYFNSRLRHFLNFKNVELVGEVGGKQKINFIKKAKALLVPSCIDETFGLVIIEALMCGTPVIAFDRGPFRELVEDGVTGFIVEPGNTNALVQAIKKTGSINRENCRNTAEKKFCRLRMSHKYLELFLSEKKLH